MHVKRFIATHYHYEEKGSLVTLTKAERVKHLESIKEILIEETENNPSELPVEEETNYFSWIMISHDGNKLNLIARK